MLASTRWLQFNRLSLMNANSGVFGVNLGHMWDEIDCKTGWVDPRYLGSFPSTKPPRPINHPRIGRIVMGRGRDAADVAMSTAFGVANSGDPGAGSARPIACWPRQHRSEPKYVHACSFARLVTITPRYYPNGWQL